MIYLFSNNHTFTYQILYSLLNINTITLFRGAKPYLSAEEETSLVKWAMDMGRRGIPQSEKHLCKAVQFILNKAKRQEFTNNNCPTKGWIKRIMGRYSDLVNKKPQPYDSGKANVTWESILEWFLKLDEYLEKEEN